MNIKWFGHSCFLLTSENGVSILTDPPAPETGYVVHDVECSAVTVSHGHFDHNYIAAAKGDPIVINDCGSHDVNGIKITGFPAFHDKEGGKKRGNIVMYLYEIDGIRILHAGDIGQVISKDEAEAIGHVDVLLVPVGGKYTIDSIEAREFANLLHPSVVIPMHYKTSMTNIDIEDCSNFIATVKDCRIHKLNDFEASIYTNTLGEDRVLVLDPYVENEE